MQNSAVLPISSGSSRSNLASSSTSTSLVRTQKNDKDELESYLSILTGKRDGKARGEKRVAVVDWGKVLDNQNEDLESCMRTEEERDSDESEDEVPTLFLKPKATTQNLQPKVDKKWDRNSTQGAQEAKKVSSQSFKHNKPPRRELELKAGTVDTHLDLMDSLSLTDTDTSSTKCADHSQARETGHFSNMTALSTEGTRVIRSPPEQTHDGRNSRRPSVISEQLRSPEEDTDSSNSSLSLDMSTHFRNNIFTLDQLELSMKADYKNEESTSPETTETSGQTGHLPPQLHSIHSLADEVSPLEESRTEHHSRAEELEPQVQNIEVDRVHGRYSFNGNDLRDEGVGDHSEDISTAAAVSYDEDFENETVQSDTWANDAGRDDLSSSQLPQARATQDSDTESEEEYSSLWKHTRTDTVPCKGSTRTLIKDGGTTVETKLPNGEAKGACSYGCPTSEVHTTPPILPEYPHLRPSSLFPHLLPTHTVSSSVSVALQDLLSCQLALTRSLVSNSRSLAQQLSDSITPNYHYTTLEETKKYISEHRPKVLTKKEAEKLVSREDNS